VALFQYWSKVRARYGPARRVDETERAPHNRLPEKFWPDSSAFGDRIMPARSASTQGARVHATSIEPTVSGSTTTTLAIDLVSPLRTRIVGRPVAIRCDLDASASSGVPSWNTDAGTKPHVSELALGAPGPTRSASCGT